jgi:antitoxin HicB
MVQTIFTYPVILEPDEDGRPVVTFPDLPGAVTDGADEAEALREASDCLSEALATRIAHGEAIPPSSPPAPGQHVVSPDPTIALKAGLHMAMYRRDMTIADLAERLEMKDWHQAARLIDPKRSSKLTSLAAALSAFGCRIAISIEDDNDPVHGSVASHELEIPLLAEKVPEGRRTEPRPLATTSINLMEALSAALKKIEIEREAAGRWIEFPELPGVRVYGTTEAEARAKVEMVVREVIATRNRERVP